MPLVNRGALAVLLSATACVALPGCWKEKDRAPRDPLVFVLAGQSNMSGRGRLKEVPSFPHADRVFVYANSGKWTAGREPVDDPTGQVDEVSLDDNARAGPGMAFGDRMAELRPGAEIGLVPAAKGGSPASEWSRDSSRKTLYGSMIARAREAAAIGRLAGVLWYQGEADIDSLTEWPVFFRQLVADIRADLGIADLPVVMTVLAPGKPQHAARWNRFVSMQASMELPPCTGRVTANDLKVEDEGVHLTTASAVTLGRRYADAMDALAGCGKQAGPASLSAVGESLPGPGHPPAP
jgi:hypothetical protein